MEKGKQYLISARFQISSRIHVCAGKTGVKYLCKMKL